MAAGRLCALTLSLFVLAPGVGLAQRLPDTVVPEHYTLQFDVDLAGARFRGTETIRLQLKEPLRRITLNALDIQFQQVTIAAAGEVQTASVALNAPTETAALTVPKNVAAGPAEIRIRYSGILNDKLRGFYLSKANGRNYAVTQMESTDARRAFPSFDEPAFKATFDVSLIVDEKDSAIANGKLLSDVPGPDAGRHTLTFATTPKMSSYLVAMAVGDFACIAGESEDVPIRICATPDKKDLGHIALDAAQQILNFYNSYYSIKYPFGKLDVVAVPDFAAGAMENTAAIFYREVDLLADDKTASVANRERIWETLAHEMAHLWFGDLVTMRWWDDLWLNEGFASWMEKRPLAALKPEWKVDVIEASDTQSAMNLDSLASTRAIHSTVETPAEIEESFDTIAYQKGGAVMSMIEGYVGADVFQRGVNRYLERHAYANATSADFWTAIAEVSGMPVDRILPTFVNRQGIPLLVVNATCASTGLTLDITQQRFLLSAPPSRVLAGGVWNIPLCVKDSAGHTSCSVMEGPRLSRTISGLTGAASPSAQSARPGAPVSQSADNCPAWAFLNAGAKGYYRTQYPPAMLRAMAPDLQARFTASERLSLVGDEWALVRAGKHSVADYMTLAAGFGSEDNSEVFGTVSGRLQLIHDYLTTPQTRTPFERYLQQLARPMFETLGFTPAPGDDDDKRALRAEVIALLGGPANDLSIGQTAQAALDRMLRGEAPLDPTTSRSIVQVAARHGDAALWDRLLAASKAATSPSERYRYLYALSAFENTTLIDRGLNFALTPDLRSQDTPQFLGRFLSNPAARDRAWAFVKEHWSQLAPKVTISLGDVSFASNLSAFCDAHSRDDITTFFKEHKLPAASRTLDQTLERIDNCISMREKQTAPLAEWLSRNASNR